MKQGTKVKSSGESRIGSVIDWSLNVLYIVILIVATYLIFV